MVIYIRHIDLCGKQRLEGEDPKWISCSGQKLGLISGLESSFKELINELVKNNSTGNTVELIDQLYRVCVR